MDADQQVPEIDENNAYYNKIITIQGNNNSGGGGTPDCSASSAFPWEDWISRIKIGEYINSSGKSTYSDFSQDLIEVNAGSAVSFELDMSYSWGTYNEYIRVWADWNRDDIFGSDELLIDDILSAPTPGLGVKGTYSGTFSVPPSASGDVKVRIIATHSSAPGLVVQSIMVK